MPNTAFTTRSSPSDMPRKVLFIVNPNAGKKISDQIIGLIRNEFPQNMYFQIVTWKDKDHFEEITELLKTQGYTDAVAVGGDGTVNRVAQSILHSDIALGILPVGSGNGLARSLGISMDLHEAIKQIVNGNTLHIDSGEINGHLFFCTSGVGFDAEIGKRFADSPTRGLKSYVRITLSQLFSYRASTYTLQVQNQAQAHKAFLITVANAGQYGNDFYIAPEARLNDGKFHVVVLKPFSVVTVLPLFIKILRKKAHRSSLIQTLTCEELVIERTSAGPIHFDGEPAEETTRLHYRIHPASLKVIVANSFL